MYHADKKLRQPFPKVYAALVDFLELASAATRPPIQASIIRYKVEPGGSHPIAQQEAWLGPDGCSQEQVQTLVEEGLRRFSEPEVTVSIRWSPNLQWKGRDTFSRIGLQEATCFRGNDQTHFLGLVSPRVPSGQVWAFVYLATPFETVGPEFTAFVREAERRLPFKLGLAQWRLCTRTKTSKRWKLQRLDEGAAS
jgi:hypothetical protein